MPYGTYVDSAGTSHNLAVENSSAPAHIIEEHFHTRERWRGKKAVQTATDWADDVLTAFQAISGNNVYGADANDEAKVLGTDDTPIISGSLWFDLHRILIVGRSSATTYKLRIVWGTGTMAAAITAGQFTEVCALLATAVGQFRINDLAMPRLAAGTQVWIQAWNATDNATIDFLVGIHEYDD